MCELEPECDPLQPDSGVNTLTGEGLADVLQGRISLVPGDGARLGETRFEEWLAQPTLAK